MTRVTTRPNATLLNTFTVVGARTADAALSTLDFGTSYIYGSSATARLGWVEPSIPTGAIVRRMEMRLWCRAQSVPVQLYCNMRANADQAAQENLLVVGNTSSTWITALAWDQIVSPTQVEGSVTISLGPDNVLISEAEIITTYVAKPTLTVDLPATGGTVRNTNLPTVSWTPTLDSDGGPQAAWAVRIFTAAQYGARGFDPATVTPFTSAPGVPPASTTWTPTTALPDGTYRAYVSIGQVVNGILHPSSWAYTEFTVAVNRPQAPTLSAADEAPYARNRLVLADGHGVIDDFNVNSLSDYTVNGEITVSGGSLVFGTAGILGSGDAIHNSVALSDAEVIADVTLGSILRSGASAYLRAASTSRSISANVTVNTLLGRGGILAVLAGTSTLASVGLRSTPAAGTRYWLRATAIGDVVTAEWWTTDPALGGSPTDTVSTTLAGANKTAYGAGVVGKAGVSAGVSDSSRALSYIGRFSAQPAIPADLFEIQSSYDGGVTWQALRTSVGDAGLLAPANGAGTTWDFEAPNGSEALYRARALHSYSGVYAASDWAQASGTWASQQEWLVHPLDPSKTMRIRLVEVAERQRQARQGIHQPLGGGRQIVVSDTYASETGTVTIDVDLVDHPSLDVLIEARVPLLILGAAGSAWPFPRYVMLGATSRIEGAQKGFGTWTLNALSWTQVDRPAGGLLSVPA